VDDPLGQTLRRLIRSGEPNAAVDALVDDFARFHVVLAVIGTVFLLAAAVATIVAWRRFLRTPRRDGRWWTFERGTYLAFGLGGVLVSAFLGLVVAANISNAVSPREGLLGSLGQIARARDGSRAAELQQGFVSWLMSDGSSMPAVIQQRIDERLAWQLPKAIVCVLLLFLLVVVSLAIWRSLIRRSRTRPRTHRARFAALLACGSVTVCASFLLMLMVMGNTQASIVPRARTLVFG
jgi:hypothetical protein